MKYKRNIWNCGDSVSAERLNHMEQGIADGSDASLEPFYVNFSHYEGREAVYDKTWQQAYDAFIEGRPVIVHRIFANSNAYWHIESFYSINNHYRADDLYTDNGKDDYLRQGSIM